MGREGSGLKRAIGLPTIPPSLAGKGNDAAQTGRWSRQLSRAASAFARALSLK